LEAVRQYKEQAAYVGDIDDLIESIVLVNGKNVTIDVSEEIRRVCEYIVQPNIDTTMKMIARYEGEYQDRICGKIAPAGEGSQGQNLVATLQTKFNEYRPSKADCLDDALFGRVDATLKLAKDMLQEY
jgi:rod shape-determining protein MreB